MRILIIVDDFLIGESLRQIVHKLGAVEYKIIDSKSFVLESIKLFLPCLVFIHIQKEKPTIGIEIGQFFSKETSFLFAYISAQSDPKTMDLAIQTNPIGYILKPYREGEIYAIMQIARQKKKMEYLHLKDNYEILQIPILDIIYIKSENNYIEIIGKNKKWVVRNTLQNIINLLPKSDFIQIHRSYVVNRKHIDKVSNKELFVEGMNIPISKSHVEKLKEIMFF